MTKETIINSLDDARRHAYAIWAEYHERSLDSAAFTDIRDFFEMRVRALDYAMEAIRHDAI